MQQPTPIEWLVLPNGEQGRSPCSLSCWAATRPFPARIRSSSKTQSHVDRKQGLGAGSALKVHKLGYGNEACPCQCSLRHERLRLSALHVAAPARLCIPSCCNDTHRRSDHFLACQGQVSWSYGGLILMEARTFSRRGRTQHQEPSPTSVGKQQPSSAAQDPFDGLVAAAGDPSDPFFFGELEEGLEKQQGARISGRGGSGRSPVSKGAGGRRLQAPPVAGAPLAAQHSPPNGRNRGGATVGTAVRGATPPLLSKTAAAPPSVRAQQQSEEHTVDGLAAQPTAQRAAAKSRQQQKFNKQKQKQRLEQQQQNKATQPQRRGAEPTVAEPDPPPGSSRPSVRSKPAARPAAGSGATLTGPAARKQGAQVNGVSKVAAGRSPGKRKAAGAPERAGADMAGAPALAAGDRSTAGKRMKQSKEGEAAAAAAAAPAAPATAPARPHVGAARPSGGGRGSGRAAPGSGGSAQLAALRPAALRGQAAATTVVQAQALGEQQSIT